MTLSEPNTPFISVVIPIRPGVEPKSTGAIRKIDYPPDRFEVLVAEGRQPSVQRNTAVKQATGDILYFLDDDSLATTGIFRAAAARFERHGDVVAMGGPILTPDTDGFLQKAYGLAFGSMFGGSSIRARYRIIGEERETDENCLILANMCFRRDAFLKAGGFNEKLYPNEENELMNRLQADGGKFLYVPDMAIYRSQRPTFRAYLKQVFTYGRGRMDQNYAHPEGFRPLHVAPSLFLLYFMSLPFVNHPLYLLPILLYAVLSAVFSAVAAVHSRNPLYTAVMPFIFLTLHLGYGAGFLWGALKGALGIRPRPFTAADVLVRKVTP